MYTMKSARTCLNSYKLAQYWNDGNCTNSQVFWAHMHFAYSFVLIRELVESVRFGKTWKPLELIIRSKILPFFKITKSIFSQFTGFVYFLWFLKLKYCRLYRFTYLKIKCSKNRSLKVYERMHYNAVWFPAGCMKRYSYLNWKIRPNVWTRW